jgi:hypothetical protein
MGIQSCYYTLENGELLLSESLDLLRAGGTVQAQLAEHCQAVAFVGEPVQRLPRKNAAGVTGGREPETVGGGLRYVGGHGLPAKFISAWYFR